MFGILSVIDNLPLIHETFYSQDSSKIKLMFHVEKMIKEKHELHDNIVYNIPLDKIQESTFSQFPSFTYIQDDSQNISIYKHTKAEVTNKGWLWNGKKNIIESNKIGFYTIISIPNPFVATTEIECAVDYNTKKKIDYTSFTSLPILNYNTYNPFYPSTNNTFQFGATDNNNNNLSMESINLKKENILNDLSDLKDEISIENDLEDLNSFNESSKKFNNSSEYNEYLDDYDFRKNYNFKSANRKGICKKKKPKSFSKKY